MSSNYNAIAGGNQEGTTALLTPPPSAAARRGHDQEGHDIERSLAMSEVDGPANHHAASDLPEPGSWRRTVLKILVSKKCEILMLLLLACDVLLVMAELEIATKVVCRIEWTEGEFVVNNSLLLGNKTINCAEAPRIAFSCEHGMRSFQLPVEFAPCPFTVTEELPEHLESAEKGVSWTSRTIIILFGIELTLLLICGGPKLFWHHKMYLVDAIIVGVSIIFDFVSLTFDLSALTEAIVVFRCWRFARIIHGVGAGVHEDKKKEEADAEARKSKEENDADNGGDDDRSGGGGGIVDSVKSGVTAVGAAGFKIVESQLANSRGRAMRASLKADLERDERQLSPRRQAAEA